MPNVTVVGASGAIVTVPFTGSANYALAQQLANIINAASTIGITGTGGGSGLLNAFNSGTAPTAGGVIEEVITVGGTVTTPAGTNFLTNASTGAVTVQASPFLNVISGTGGLTFFGAAGGLSSIAAGGGSNYIALPDGSSYYVAIGGGPNTVDAIGSGTVDASAGSKNTIFVSQFAGTSNAVFSAGTGDTIVAGAGVATIGETGSGATIFLGTGQDLVADGGTNDTIVGGTVASAQTIFGGAGEVVFGNADTLTFVAGVNTASTIVGGTKDTIFGSSGSSVTWIAGTSNATLVAGAGNETLNASGSTQSDFIQGGSGATTISLGSGADTLAFFDGKAGGTDVVSGFTSSDTLADIGYGGASPTVTTSGGSTIISLSDGTKITLSNFTSSTFTTKNL
jgi:serralysin